MSFCWDYMLLLKPPVLSVLASGLTVWELFLMLIFQLLFAVTGMPASSKDLDYDIVAITANVIAVVSLLTSMF